jgi:peptidoglycan/xylan/chitin deacetylase (PgdA/CDA1 family)
VPEPTPTLVPPLTRDALKNAAYPLEWPAGGVAQLADGVYREKYTPDSATEMVIRLTHLVVYGDLDGDGVEDAVAILVADPGGSGTFYYLTPILNHGGVPRPLASQFLGDRVVLRLLEVDGGEIVVELDLAGPEDAFCCPTDRKRLTYRLEGDDLAQVDVVDLPDPEVSARLGHLPQRVEIEPDDALVTLEDHVGFNGINGYLVGAQAGQVMTVTLTSPHDDVWLSVRGHQDGVVLTSIFSESTRWAGEVPGTQDYLINAVAAGGETGYSLQIELAGGVVPTPVPQPTVPTPPSSEAADKVIYLTFDDGPTDPRWTPQVLEALARHDARVTFFVLGRQVEWFPELVAAEVQAGHTVANHTYDHHTLDAIGREAFFKEIQDAEALLGDLVTKCLRPPYGATDAYTRAYAAELGYSLVLWDIDTRDWSQPGVDAIVSTVLTKAFPGAVVLFHDGGGDRAQTVEALDRILQALSERGYRFEPVCP